jgi:predicted regulator of Ras-like GTPase activity (Roadblock/LC7/MglB family)
LYRHIRTAVREIGSGDAVEAVVISAESATFVSWPLTDEFFWHVVTTPETTLGFTRAIMRKVSEDVKKGVADLLDD